MPSVAETAHLAPTPLTVLSDEEKMFQSTVRRFARERIGPHVREMDEAGVFRKDLLHEMFELGLMGIEIPEEHGGHCELEFDGLEIGDENVLMKSGDGLKITQIRLGPARLTHCMRWLGMAQRALQIASDYVRQRDNFGSKLTEHEGVQWLLGDAAMQVEIGRLLTMRAAWRLDQNEHALQDISMAKIHVSNILQQAVDTSLQLMGALGYSKDTKVEWMYRYARQARLVDGASEVHKMILARLYLKSAEHFWRWGA